MDSLSRTMLSIVSLDVYAIPFWLAYAAERCGSSDYADGPPHCRVGNGLSHRRKCCQVIRNSTVFSDSPRDCGPLAQRYIKILTV